MSARPFPPYSIPPLGDLVRGGDPKVEAAMRRLEEFLYSLTFAQVQGLAAVSSPTLAKGDLIYKPEDTPVPDARLPIGAENDVLSVQGGIPAWSPVGSPSGLANANTEGISTEFVRRDHQHKRDVRVKLNGVDLATRNALNFIATAGIVDDSGNDEVDVDITAAAGTAYRRWVFMFGGG